MDDLVERVRGISATGHSPDYTVKVTFGGTGAPKVELTPGALRQHTESSLATAAVAALTEAMGIRQKKFDELRDAVRGGPPPQLRGTAAERQARFTSAVGAVTVSASSPRGHVTVDWRSGGFEVKIRSGALKVLGLGEAGLAAELSAAVAAVMSEHSARVIEIHKEVYRSGGGAKR